MPDTAPTSSSNPALVAITWLVVVAPAIWGLSYTVKNAAKLFAPHAAATAPASPSPASASPASAGPASASPASASPASASPAVPTR